MSPSLSRVVAGVTLLLLAGAGATYGILLLSTEPSVRCGTSGNAALDASLCDQARANARQDVVPFGVAFLLAAVVGGATGAGLVLAKPQREVAAQ